MNLQHPSGTGSVSSMRLARPLSQNLFPIWIFRNDPLTGETGLLRVAGMAGFEMPCRSTGRPRGRREPTVRCNNAKDDNDLSTLVGICSGSAGPPISPRLLRSRVEPRPRPGEHAHRSNLTYGRCSRQPHQVPESVGQAQRERGHSSRAAFQASGGVGPFTRIRRLDRAGELKSDVFRRPSRPRPR